MKYLFRGKRVDNGEWVEGDLLHNAWTKDSEIISVGMHYNYPVEVDPETVVQAIDHIDINNKDIFSGDKVRVWNNEYYSNEHITFDVDSENGCWEFEGVVTYESCMWVVTDSDNCSIPFCDIIYEGMAVEITGNIHEDK